MFAYAFGPWEMSGATRWAERWEGRGFPRHCFASGGDRACIRDPGCEQLPLQCQPAATGDDPGRLDVEFSRLLCDYGLLCELAGRRRQSPGQPRG